MTQLRWKLADDEDAGQTALFGMDDIVGPQRGTGRMSGLEFLHVAAKRILNPVPPGSRMPFRWTINVYRGCSHACVYCFARPTHEYLGLNVGEDFDRKIVVKINAVEKLRAELADPAWAHSPVAMGTNTDPYQRCEAKYKLTRGVLEALVERGNPFSILTKSPLVLRDLDLLTRAAAVTDITVNFSIATLDETVWRATEPGTPHPARRIEAMRQLRQRGIRSGALIAPVLPLLSDQPDQLRAVAGAIRAAGGTVIGVMPLHLRPGTREHFLSWLQNYDARLHAEYVRRYATSAYAPQQYARHLQTIVTESSTLQRLEDKSLPIQVPG
jgi:DNA repair photolyase